MKKIALGLAILAGLATGGSAIAADLPMKAPPPAPAVVYDWSGFYVGAQVGGKWNNDDWNTTCINAGGPPLGTCGSPLSLIAFPGAPDATSAQSFTNSGFRWGFYGGYNYQVTPNWLVGVEADVGFYNRSSTVGFIPGCATAACTGIFVPPFSGDSTTVRNDGDASLRGRLGFIATPDILIYGTGGVAWQRIGETVICNGTTGAMCLFNHTDVQQKTLLGWTLGGGLEFKVWQNWILRGEYRYSEFQSFSPVFFANSGDAEVHANIKMHSQIATFGVAYKFGGGPVVAKY
jgi:outer membrane immunogenic protein